MTSTLKTTIKSSYDDRRPLRGVSKNKLSADISDIEWQQYEDFCWAAAGSTSLRSSVKNLIHHIDEMNEVSDIKCRKALQILSKDSLHNDIVFALRVFLISKNKLDSKRQAEYLQDVHKRVS